MDINESLSSKYGWSSGRKVAGGAPAGGMKRSGLNKDVLGWVGSAAVRKVDDTLWLYKVMSWPGMEPAWVPCKYNGERPKFEAIVDLINWAKTKKFQGLNIID